MPHKILNIIHKAHKRGEKLFAVLIDPEKCNGSRLTAFVRLTEKAKPDFIFIGGSQIKESIDQSVGDTDHTDGLHSRRRRHTYSSRDSIGYTAAIRPSDDTKYSYCRRDVGAAAHIFGSG